MTLLRLLPLLALLGTAQPGTEDEAALGTYRCTIRSGPGSPVDITQKVDASGRILETDASWVEPTAYTLHPRKKGAPQPLERGYMTISVNGRHSPSETEPGWFDLAGAKVQITVVTPGKLRGPTAIVFRRPSRVGERYEDGLSLLADSSKYVPWTVASVPYRVIGGFAEGERELGWQLLRWVGGDVRWNPEAQGRFDLRKVDAFAESTEAARPALAELRAEYRTRCQFQAPAEESSDPQI
jgi:hypothetical protein